MIVVNVYVYKKGRWSQMINAMYVCVLNIVQVDIQNIQLNFVCD